MLASYSVVFFCWRNGRVGRVFLGAVLGLIIATALVPMSPRAENVADAVPLSWTASTLERMTEAVANYQKIEALGGWPIVQAGPSLHENATDMRVSRLRARLADSGDLPNLAPAARPTEYDAGLVDAVRRFQIRHGLVVDGIVGRETIAALNVSAAERAAQLALNLERLKRLAEESTEAVVIVNIPAATLQLEEGVRTVLVSRAVVGNPGWPTPLIEGTISQIEINPDWNVPARIARLEILPQIAKDREYLIANNMRVLFGERESGEVPLEAIDWSRFLTLGYRLRQGPGPSNPMGAIKFIFPNRHAVFIHDTPAKRTFAKSNRALSHGCVRVERPLDLASRLLDDDPAWTAASLRTAIELGKTKRVNLRQPTRVRTVYVTAWAAADGSIQFRPDVYGYDVAKMATIDSKFAGCSTNNEPHVGPN